MILSRRPSFDQPQQAQIFPSDQHDENQSMRKTRAGGPLQCGSFRSRRGEPQLCQELKNHTVAPASCGRIALGKFHPAKAPAVDPARQPGSA